MAISVADFFEELSRFGIDYFTGVPDSLLKDFCSYAKANIPSDRFLIAANEGNAVAVAAGYYVATGRPAVVFMQNSGLGNATNPLLSLADEDVYSIPMLLLVGWRGEPGVKDEPQHVKQGKVTLGMLDVMGVSHDCLSEERFADQIAEAARYMQYEKKPYALVARKAVFSKYAAGVEESGYFLTREKALESIVDALPSGDFIVSTTGKTSRELFEIRERTSQDHAHDFLTVGSMGHASSIAYGLAVGAPDRNYWCIDGDGAMLMHMGALPVIAERRPANYRYIVNVNGAHESVGGQPTVGFAMNVPALLEACGFKNIEVASTAQETADAVKRMATASEPAALVLFTAQGSRPDLGRPSIGPAENMKAMTELLWV